MLCHTYVFFFFLSDIVEVFQIDTIISYIIKGMFKELLV